MNWFKKAQKNMWDKNSALQYLNSIYPILEKAGYSAKIIGSVATKGFSNKDLDILLTPKDNFDFEIIMENIQGDFSINQETYYTALPDGRIVDFFFNQE